LPPWQEQPYHAAIQELATIGASEILTEQDPEIVRAILSVIAIARGARTDAKFLINYSEEEMLEIETRAGM
jgi:hypothetical protein